MHFAESGRLLSGVLKQQQKLAEKLKEAQGTRSRQVRDAAQKRLRGLSPPPLLPCGPCGPATLVTMTARCRRLFSRLARCSALGPGHGLNTGAAADRAPLEALLVAFIPFFSSGARFDVFPRRRTGPRTGCSASLLRKGNARP